MPTTLLMDSYGSFDKLPVKGEANVKARIKQPKTLPQAIDPQEAVDE
jgi:hypothetical protein